MINDVLRSFMRTIGRVLAYVLIGSIIGYFAFIFKSSNVKAAELVEVEEGVSLMLDNNIIPDWYGVAANSSKSFTLKFMVEDPSWFQTNRFNYVIIPICGTGPISNWTLGTTGNYGHFDIFWTSYDSGQRCQVHGNTGTVQYMQLKINSVGVQDGYGVMIQTYLTMINKYDYTLHWQLENVYLSKDDYLHPIIKENEYQDSVKETNDKIDTTNKKLDEAENTRKGIWGTLKSVLSSIGNLPGLIWNAIKGGFDAITNALVSLGNFIIDGLKSLFIPEDEFFSNYFDELYTFFSNKLGILMYPLDLILDVFDRFLSLDNNSNGHIHIPSISVGSFGELISERDFYINEYWEEEPYKTIRDVYVMFVNFFVGMCLIRLAIKKEKEIVGGDNSDN